MAQKKKIFSSSSSFIHRNCLNFSLVRVYLFFLKICCTFLAKHSRQQKWTRFLKNDVDLLWRNQVKMTRFLFVCNRKKKKENKKTKMFVHFLIPGRKNITDTLSKRWKNGREIVCWFNGIFRTRCALSSSFFLLSCFRVTRATGRNTRCASHQIIFIEEEDAFCFVNIFFWWPIL